MEGNNKIRLDLKLLNIGLAKTRSQANNLIRLSKVKVNNKVINKSSYLVENKAIIVVDEDTYVSRAAYKLESIFSEFKINFKNKKILDVGSSTGGFSEFSLKKGAAEIIAVEKGSEQMDKKLRQDSRIKLFEKTDILDINNLEFMPDIVLVDLSFTSIREVLEHILSLVNRDTYLIVMLKPQFETKLENYKHKGVIKNQKIRRLIINNFEEWVKKYCLIMNKADSKIKGSKGNIERFYLLKKI